MDTFTRVRKLSSLLLLHLKYSLDHCQDIVNGRSLETFGSRALNFSRLTLDRQLSPPPRNPGVQILQRVEFKTKVHELSLDEQKIRVRLLIVFQYIPFYFNAC